MKLFSLPTIGKRDVVDEIERKREAFKKRRITERCFGTLSCDCRKCRRPSSRP